MLWETLLPFAPRKGVLSRSERRQSSHRFAIDDVVVGWDERRESHRNAWRDSCLVPPYTNGTLMIHPETLTKFQNAVPGVQTSEFRGRTRAVLSKAALFDALRLL